MAHKNTKQATSETREQQRPDGQRKLGILLQQIIATGVRRWHTDSAMCLHPQTVGEHKTNLGLILLAICPDGYTYRKEMFLAVLSHDMGEYFSGDLPSTVGWYLKTIGENPRIGDLDAVEREGTARLGLREWEDILTAEEYQLLKTADHIDLWMYAILELLRGNHYAEVWLGRIQPQAERYRNLNEKTQQLFAAMENAACQGKDGILCALEAAGFREPFTPMDVPGNGTGPAE